MFTNKLEKEYSYEKALELLLFVDNNQPAINAITNKYILNPINFKCYFFYEILVLIFFLFE